MKIFYSICTAICFLTTCAAQGADLVKNFEGYGSTNSEACADAKSKADEFIRWEPFYRVASYGSCSCSKSKKIQNEILTRALGESYVVHCETDVRFEGR